MDSRALAWLARARFTLTLDPDPEEAEFIKTGTALGLWRLVLDADGVPYCDWDRFCRKELLLTGERLNDWLDSALQAASLPHDLRGVPSAFARLWRRELLDRDVLVLAARLVAEGHDLSTVGEEVEDAFVRLRARCPQRVPRLYQAFRVGLSARLRMRLGGLAATSGTEIAPTIH